MRGGQGQEGKSFFCLGFWGATGVGTNTAIVGINTLIVFPYGSIMVPLYLCKNHPQKNPVLLFQAPTVEEGSRCVCGAVADGLGLLKLLRASLRDVFPHLGEFGCWLLLA